MSVFDFKALPNFDKESPPLRKFLARDNVALSYRFYNSCNEERAIILLHGSSAHGTYLHGLADYLSAKRNLGHVYVPNLRGHYKSGNVRGDCAYIGQLEDDLYDFIHEVQAQNKKIFLVGHSSGGGLAIRVAGGTYSNLIQGYVLLSPAIPTAKTMRKGTAGGWAKVSMIKMIALSFLNSIGIKNWNHSHVIQFNKPQEHCDGKETLSYSFNLNSSYHPRHPYQKDLKNLRNKFIVFIGSDDEANDPLQFSSLLKGASREHLQMIKGVRHLDIVCNEQVMNDAATWIETFVPL
jgi:non-heme chloroperoxidase